MTARASGSTRVEPTVAVAQLSHGQTRYLTAGSGAPVILLHGVDYTSGGDRWRSTIEALASEYRALAPDFLGWGYGDRLDREYSFAYLVDFVREFQDALGIERAHLVGHSMGGWIASLVAYESPHRVARLVLVASGGVATRPLPQMTAFAPPSPDDLERFFRATHRAEGAELARLVEDALKKAAVPGGLEGYRKILSHMTDPAHRQRYNTRRRLPHITAPTLIIWGRDDTVNALEMGEETHRRIPRSRLAVLDGCGHYPPTECPDQFNRLLLEFLREPVD
jgi:pimeloyl-ACP methyl ester carboxylesterase